MDITAVVTVLMFAIWGLPFVKNEPAFCIQCATITYRLPTCGVEKPKGGGSEDVVLVDPQAMECPDGPPRDYILEYYEKVWNADMSAYKTAKMTSKEDTACTFTVVPISQRELIKTHGKAFAGCIPKELSECFDKLNKLGPQGVSEISKICPKIRRLGQAAPTTSNAIMANTTEEVDSEAEGKPTTDSPKKKSSNGEIVGKAFSLYALALATPVYSFWSY